MARETNNTEKELTAVQWLHNKWMNEPEWKFEVIQEWFKTAKKMEQEQLRKSYDDGDRDGFFRGRNNYMRDQLR